MQVRLETENLGIICSVLGSGQGSGIIPELLVQQLNPAAPIEITPLPESRQV